MASRSKPALTIAPRGNPLAPVPRAQPHFDAAHADGWSNTVTGLGDINRDKRLQTSLTPDYFTQVELEEFYRGSDVAGIIVDAIPDEELRGGFSVAGSDKDACEALAAAAGQGNTANVQRPLDVARKFRTARKYQRAYGGGALLLGVDDGQPPFMPLDESRIRSFTWITALTAEECQPAARYTDPLSDKYGEPKLYRIVPMVTPASTIIIGTDAGRMPSFTTLVHESRVIAFPGLEFSRRQLARSYNFGWGDSVLARCYRIIRDFDAAWDGAFHLTTDFAQGVIKLKGLYESVISEDPNVSNGLVARMASLDYMRSVARLIAIDAEAEDFQRQTTPLSGLPDLLDRFCNRVSMTARIPVTKLMGQSPAGLQATGDSDIRWFYDSVENDRQVELRPRLERVLRLMQLSKTGPTNGRLIDGWSVVLAPLWELTDLEEAQVRLAHAQADQIEIQEGVVTPEEVATSRHGGDQWSSHTVLNKDLRAKMAAAPEPEPDDGSGDPEMDPALADPNAVNPKTALQGPQVLAMLQIVQAVAGGDIPRDTGIQMIAASFPVGVDEATKIMGSVGAGFEAKPKPVPPAFGAPAAAPVTKPEGEKPGGPVQVTAHERAGTPVEPHTRAAPEPGPEEQKPNPAKTDSAGTTTRKPRRGKR